MTTGELLFTMLQARGGVLGTWDELTDQWQAIFEAAGGDFMGALLRQTGPLAPRVWKTELEKYGRHLASCPIGAECTCGFAEIEKELAA